MTGWNKAISWDKLRSALTCHRQLQLKIEKAPASYTNSNYYRQLGIVVQKIFELYFNQNINRTEAGRTTPVFERVIEKVLTSDYFLSLEIDYDTEKTEDTFKEDVRRDVLAGFEIMRERGMLTKVVRSEEKWVSVFRGLKTFAMIDFIYEDKGVLHVFDGKGNNQKDADPRQLLYYALSVAASGRTLGEGGFLYWKHGYEPVAMDPISIRRFIEETLDTALPVLNKLKVGTSEDLPSNPSPTNCNFCSWKLSCQDSVYKRLEPDNPDRTIMEVGFKDGDRTGLPSTQPEARGSEADSGSEEGSPGTGSGGEVESGSGAEGSGDQPG